MRAIDQIYVDGNFVAPHGQDLAPLFNPATEEQIGTVRLGDEIDADAAVAAAKRAFPAMVSMPARIRSYLLMFGLTAGFQDGAADCPGSP